MDKKDLDLIKKVSTNKDFTDEEKIKILESLFPTKVESVPTFPMCPCPSYPPTIPYWTVTSGTTDVGTFGVDCSTANDDNFTFTFGGVTKKDESDKD